MPAAALRVVELDPHVAAAHVPYAVLLYERYLGRPFASHRDAVSELVGDVMESAIEECLSRARITFRKTKRAERMLGVLTDLLFYDAVLDAADLIRRSCPSLSSIGISDYKTTGVWAVMNEKKEWEYQLNIYAWLVERVKKSPVDSLEIVAIIRDWKRWESEVKKDYPDAPIKTIPITLWPYEEREKFVRQRIHVHADAMFQYQTGGDLPLCTPDEMCEKPTVWAVKKPGAARAKSLHYTEEQAIRAAGDDLEIELRQGERTRCANYCQVRDFCDQWKSFNSK